MNINEQRLITSREIDEQKRGSHTKIYTKGDNIYYNVTIAHDDTVAINGSPTLASYFEVRSTNLFDGPPEDYTMSVVRMKIPSSLIPIQIFPNDADIPPATPNAINISIYTVTLSWNGSNYRVPLVWQPQLQLQPNLIPNSPNEGILRKKYAPYYSMFSVEHFINIINVALLAAFNLVSAAGSTITAPPFMGYDKITKLMTLYVPEDYQTEPTGPVEIFTNNFLNRNFGNGFNQEFFGYAPVPPDGTDNKFIIEATAINRETLTDPTYGQTTYIKSTQDYTSIGDMTSAQSIVLASRSIPVRKEWISQQNIRVALGRPSLPANNSTQDGFINILTDYEFDINGFEFRNTILYNPTAEYRRATLKGRSPIRTIDIQVFWKDNFDNLYEILIPAHDVLTIKILFEHK